MAQRRMFSKSITSSGKFLKMPPTSRLLYYDLGMNADDDGYAEWFTVIRMTGSTEQDMQVLKANGFVQIFDENVLIILDWKENNLIRSDRYTPSKYLDKYNDLDRLEYGIPNDNQMTTSGIPLVNPGKVRIGKDRLICEPSSRADIPQSIEDETSIESPFSFDEELTKMLAGQKHIKAIAIFLKEKRDRYGTDFTTKEQLDLAIKRYLRPGRDIAKAITSARVLNEAMERAFKMCGEETTMETVIKYLTK